MNRSRPLTAAAITFTGVFALGALGLWSFESDRASERRRTAEGLARSKANALDRILEVSLGATHALAAQAAHRNPNGRFEAVAEALAARYPGLCGVLLAPGGVVRSAHPPVAHRWAVGLDLRQADGH